MGKHREHFASAAVLVIALFAAIPAPLIASPLQAQSQTSTEGIDPELLAKAGSGDIDSQMRVAAAYAKGDGIPQDFGEAAKWLRKAADEGNDRAALNLGILYHQGKGVPNDDVQAVFWYRKAAEDGDPDAQFALATHLENGEGVSKDYAQAIDWYRRAAEHNFTKAQVHLGDLYEDGQIVPRDEGIAAAWFSEAAQHGNLYAQTRLEWLRNEQASRIESRDRAITAAIWICVALLLLFLLRRYQSTLLALGRKLRPRTVRAKQLTILLLTASWCTVCCLYQLWEMWHPVEAAVTALLLCTPAVVFGAAGFWWLSQAASNEKSNLKS